MDDLEADVAAHGHGAEIAVDVVLNKTGQHLLGDVEAVGKTAGRPERFGGQCIVAVPEIIPAIERNHSRNADEAERHGIEQKIVGNRRVGRIILVREDIAFVVQRLFATAVVRTHADAVIFAHFLRRLQPQRRQLVLDPGRVDEAILAITREPRPAAPAPRVSQLEQVIVSIIDVVRRELDHAVGAKHEIHRVAGAIRRAAARPRVNFDIVDLRAQLREAGIPLQRQPIAGVERHVEASGKDL